MSNEELKPCPFCNASPIFSYQTYACRCLSMGYKSEYPWMSKEKWNSAYCWKELDALHKQNEELKQKCLRAEAYIADMECQRGIGVNRQLNEAVEVLERMFNYFKPSKDGIVVVVGPRGGAFLNEAKEFLDKIRGKV